MSFKEIKPNIDGNKQLREPQSDTYSALAAFVADAESDEREVGIVLPVGCGKSGCITLAPFAFKAKRV